MSWFAYGNPENHKECINCGCNTDSCSTSSSVDDKNINNVDEDILKNIKNNIQEYLK